MTDNILAGVLYVCVGLMHCYGGKEKRDVRVGKFEGISAWHSFDHKHHTTRDGWIILCLVVHPSHCTSHGACLLVSNMNLYTPPLLQRHIHTLVKGNQTNNHVHTLNKRNARVGNWTYISCCVYKLRVDWRMHLHNT